MFSTTIRNSILSATKVPTTPILFSPRRGLLTHVAFNRAAKKGDVDTVSKYLDNKFNPQLTNMFKQNPILGAASANQHLVLEQILAHIKDQQQTPDEQLWKDAISIALDNNFDNCLRTMLRYSCKFPLRYNAEIIEAKTSIMHLLVGRQVVLIPKTEYCYVYHPAFGMSEIHMCAEMNEDAQKQIDRACGLIRDNAAGINSQSKGGMTPTHICAQEGSNAFLLFLLGRDADISLSNAIGETPLGTAARFARLKSYEILLDAGARQTPNIYGETPEEVLAKHKEKKIHRPSF